MSTLHERAIIRNAVVSMLTTQSGDPAAYPTDCAERVFSSRIQPLLVDTLPAASVYTLDESVDRAASTVWTDPDNPGILKRLLQLAIEIVTAGDGCEAALDALALQVETVMDSDPTIGKRVASTMLDSTEPAFVDSGEKVVAILRLIYSIEYYTKTRTGPASAGVVPTTVFGSLSPNIGAAHKDDYVDITGIDIELP